MQFITAQRIHDGHKWLPQGATIVLTDDGTISAISETEIPGTIHHDGVLCPGFVNAHCHLELSHMKGVVPEHTGLIPFLKSIPQYRNSFTAAQKETARTAAFRQMQDNGIVAVGDIANTTETADLRASGQMHFHTFVEALGFTPQNAGKSFQYSKATFDTFAGQPAANTLLRQSITPHAPYSVSEKLFDLIDKHQAGSIISIHNQESEEENTFYKSGKGKVCELLEVMGIDHSSFTPPGQRSLPAYLKWLSPEHPFIFVHNTSSQREDVQFATKYAPDSFWCLCPNANLYIENRLPDVDMLIAEGCNICIGTDSLASNHALNVAWELETLKQHFPHLSWETLLRWGTYNGATALQMEESVGSLKPGTRPGILLLKGVEDNEKTITVKRLC